MTKEEFEKSNLYSEVLYHDEYGYTRYGLKRLFIGDDRVAVTLYFNPDGEIDSVEFTLTSSETCLSWDDWSKEGEMKKKAKNDKWLKKHLGRPRYEHFMGCRNPIYRYDWGSVSSAYDCKSASSGITVRYYNEYYNKHYKQQPIKKRSRLKLWGKNK